MKKFHCLVGLASALAVFPACTLITDFDLEGKPCDGLRRCEDGYYCRIEDESSGAGRCMKGSDPSAASGFLPVSAEDADDGADGAEPGEELEMDEEGDLPASGDADGEDGDEGESDPRE